MPVVSTFDSKEVQVTLLALRTIRADLRKELYARARSKILPDWNEALATQIGGNKFDSQLIIRNTRVKLGTNGVTLEAATRTKKTVSGGLSPNPYWYLAEYGAKPRMAEIAGRRGTTRYSYKRKILTGIKPRRREGYIVGKVEKTIVKRTLALWVESTFQVLYEAFEKGK